MPRNLARPQRSRLSKLDSRLPLDRDPARLGSVEYLQGFRLRAREEQERPCPVHCRAPRYSETCGLPRKRYAQHLDPFYLLHVAPRRSDVDDQPSRERRPGVQSYPVVVQSQLGRTPPGLAGRDLTPTLIPRGPCGPTLPGARTHPHPLYNFSAARSTNGTEPGKRSPLCKRCLPIILRAKRAPRADHGNTTTRRRTEGKQDTSKSQQERSKPKRAAANEKHEAKNVRAGESGGEGQAFPFG